MNKTKRIYDLIVEYGARVLGINLLLSFLSGHYLWKKAGISLIKQLIFTMITISVGIILSQLLNQGLVLYLYPTASINSSLSVFISLIGMMIFIVLIPTMIIFKYNKYISQKIFSR